MIEVKLFTHHGTEEQNQELARLLNDHWVISHFAAASQASANGPPNAPLDPVALILLTRNVSRARRPVTSISGSLG
jgi:hypothetical protein